MLIHSKSNRQQSNRHAGFGLIEVIVSVLVISIGLLGVASMQVSSIKMNQGAYHQSQANILINEMFDRMRLNREAFIAGHYDDVTTNSEAPSAQSCITSATGCSNEQLANNDIRDFSGFFNDVNALGDNFFPFIPGGSASIARNAVNSEATVTVSWNQDVWTNIEGVRSKNSELQQLTITVRI